MKKLFISAAIVAVVGVAGCFASQWLNPNRGLTPTQIANIEALADSENSGTRIKCYTSFTYSVGDAVVDCSTCEIYEDHKDAWCNIHDYCWN